MIWNATDGHQKLTGVNPRLILVMMTAAYRFNLAHTKRVRFTSGVRSREEQADLLKRGKTTTMNSMHLTGRAVDVAILKEDGRVLWDFEDYRLLWNQVETVVSEFDIDVTWGGHWGSRDGPHFQLEFQEATPRSPPPETPSIGGGGRTRKQHIPARRRRGLDSICTGDTKEPMHNLILKEESPSDRGIRNQALAMALRGKLVSRHHALDEQKPFCDDPVLIHREVRAGGLKKAIAVTNWRPCRRCSKCLQFRQMQWRERCLIEIEKAPRTWFVTLTFSPHHLAGIIFESQKIAKASRDKRIDAAAFKHVQLFFKRLRKATGQKFRYLAVFELGEKTGRPHYHLLLHEVQRPITKAIIESQWRSNVHCRLVAGKAGGAASYITKYATKSFDIAPRASLGYGKAPA